LILSDIFIQEAIRMIKTQSFETLNTVLNGLMQRYIQRVPDVAKITSAMIHEGLISRPSDIENDHIAFRTMGVHQLGIASLEKIFLYYGYTRREQFNFDQKKLNAYWYAPPTDKLPRIFISELRVAELSQTAQNIITRYTNEVKSDPVLALDLDNAAAVDVFLHQSLWSLPTYDEYMQLMCESEYAAWVIYNRYYLNHYTISVHNLPVGYDTCEQFNVFLKRNGIKLNTSGGEVKKSPDGLLLQSSTVAEMIDAEFAGGETHSIAGSYIEFAERRVLPEFAHLEKSKLTRDMRREGFEAGNADKIFESTFSSQTKVRIDPTSGLRKAHASPIKYPTIKTTLPGPRAQELLKRESVVMSTSNSKSIPIVADHGNGVWVTDVDGNEFLDMMAGIAVNTTGYAHPKIVKAVTEQAQKIVHMCGAVFPFDPLISLAERLSAKLDNNYRVFLGNSGTEGVEVALKFARYHTKRPHFIAFTGSFHGRSAGSLSLTASNPKYRRGFGQMAYPVTHVPFPNPFRPPLGSNASTCGDAVIEHFHHLFKTSCVPEDVAAIVMEPIQGEGGYIVPPVGFVSKLHALAKEYGIMLIMDEVQTGVGRTGKFFAFEHEGIEPEVVILAKGLASGYPISATLFRKDLMKWEAGAHGSTFGGNAVSCAAAHATLDLVEDELMTNASNMGVYLMNGMNELKAEFPRLGDVRGRGLMIGLDFVKTPNSTSEDSNLRDRVQQVAYEQGMLVLSAGPSAVRLAPPLVLNQDEANVAIDLMAHVFSKAM
jgi:4-aminobutyrate aminotransferase